MKAPVTVSTLVENSVYARGLACAHSGVVNTLEYIRRLTGDRPIQVEFLAA